MICGLFVEDLSATVRQAVEQVDRAGSDGRRR